MKVHHLLILAGLLASPVMADESQLTDKPQAPSDEKVSYALGMNLGEQIKRVGVDVDVDVIAQAVKDVLDGKPARLKDEELRAIFSKSQDYAIGKRKMEGEAFLEKNAKAEGVKVLPDGLQYRVIAPGAGETIKSNDVAVVNFRGTWIDGKEFRNHQHVQLMADICPAGIREALFMMKPGAKWDIYVRSDLSYGEQMGQSIGFGSALIYEIEVISAGPDAAHTAVIYGSGRLGHAPGDDFLPAVSVVKDSPSATKTVPRQNPNIVFPSDTAK